MSGGYLVWGLLSGVFVVIPKIKCNNDPITPPSHMINLINQININLIVVKKRIP